MTKKKNNQAKGHVNIGAVGHVDNPQVALKAARTHMIKDALELKKSTREYIEEAKKYIKPETLSLWETFSAEYEYFYSGLFIKRLVTVLRYFHEGKSLEEIKEYFNGLEFNSYIINYICIALIRFSDQGLEFYEKFYTLDVPEDGAEIINHYETAMCRLLTKKENNK